ncbi:MAG: selenide, water dikinase SelD [Bacteroidota bacterium]
MTNSFRLTQYAKSAGCGCKIAPAVLADILSLSKNNITPAQPNLLVGNSSNDDAAVYDLGNGQALIVTADFFMPIVDDAFTFGQVAAANAISDVYAMGGKPVTAIALLGWPVDKIPAEVAAQVMQGAQQLCALAGIVISGGHTIDAPEPFFGLSVNGLMPVKNLKQNNTANEGDVILLSKPIGVGIMATAQKRGLLQPAHEAILVKQLTELNAYGELLGHEEAVTAMTDVTGFGLLGHLMEMSEGANLLAEIEYNAIPKLAEALEYLKQNIVPDATYRNWNAYESKTGIASSVDAMESFMLLPDPQTNGGLLIAVKPEHAEMIIAKALANHTTLHRIGYFTAAKNDGLRMKIN